MAPYNRYQRGIPREMRAALTDWTLFSMTGTIMRRLTPSPLLRQWRIWHARHWRRREVALDLRMAVLTALHVTRAAGKPRRPLTYLEVGVRRGWTLAQALSLPTVRAIGVDPWLGNYAEEPNPGEGFVRAEMARLYGDVGDRMTLHTGYSQEALPDILRPFWRENRWLDVAVIDGDHEAEAAWQDCRLIFPHLRPDGGMVIIDDLVPEPSEYPLRHIWQRVKQTYGDKCLFIERFRAETPLGIAIRVKK